MKLIFSGDTEFQLFCNEALVAIWYAEIAPIAVRAEETLTPMGKNRILLKPYEEKEVVLEFVRSKIVKEL